MGLGHIKTVANASREPKTSITIAKKLKMGVDDSKVMEGSLV